MIRMSLLAHPGARQERLELVDDATLAVWVRARPVDNQANRAIERLLAAALGLRATQVNVVVGAAGRRKIVEMELPGLEALRDRLMAYGLRS